MYDKDIVWDLLLELYEISSVDSINYDEKWSFKKLCEKHGLPQTYGTIINNNTAWLKDGKWDTILPRKVWMNILIEEVKKYHSRSNDNWANRKLRKDQQESFNESIQGLMDESRHQDRSLDRHQFFKKLTKLCDSFVIFKDVPEN